MILPTQPLDLHPLRQATLTTQPDGTPISELRYTAYGEERYASGETPTGYRYTGQLSKLDTTGLYYYGARWYDPGIMAFASADTLIPDPGNPLDWNRYMYVRANPIYYNDPSGHDPRPGRKGDYKLLGPNSPKPPKSISGQSIGGEKVGPGEWQLVADGDGIVTWYEIKNVSGYDDPYQMSEEEQAAARMQGTIIINGVSWSWKNDEWIRSPGTGCDYSNSVHCVYPSEDTNGHAPTAAVSPDGNIPTSSDTFNVQVDPTKPFDDDFGEDGKVFNVYDGCHACVPDKGVDLLTVDVNGHYGYNGEGGAPANVNIWLWGPNTSNGIDHYGDRY
jgi:RHS repeat-associated protein